MFSITAYLRTFAIVALSVALTGVRANAQVLFQDNFDRADSLNALGTAQDGVGGPLNWNLQRDADNSSGPYDTIAGVVGPDVEIINNMLRLNCGGKTDTPSNNNDMASWYVDSNLDAVQQYSTTFKYMAINIHPYSTTNTIGSQRNGGFFILPRAQGTDFPGNTGYVIRRSADAGTTLGIYFYTGNARAQTPANIPLNTLTLLSEPSVFSLDTSLNVRVDTYGPSGNFARLIINDQVIDTDRSLGTTSFYNNGTADHVLFGYNSLGTGGRRGEALMDDLLATTNIGTFGSNWITNGNGSWTTAGNWSALGVPNMPGAYAGFGNVITAPRTVTVDAGQTTGWLVLDSAFKYTIAGPGELTLDFPGGNAHVLVRQGSHQVSTQINLNRNTTFTSAAGSGVAVTGTLNASGRVLTKDGAGTVQFENVRATSLIVSAGSVKISAKGTPNSPAGTSVVGSLSIAAGASLDLTNNSMIIDYNDGSLGTLVDDVRQHLQNGRLTTTPGDANHRIGYGDNAVLNKPDFGGQGVDTSSILIKYTFAGDANLDGQVDVTDLGALATNWQTNNVWTGGDFNYDGFVDVTDLGALATNWQAGVGAPLAPSRLDEALAAVGLVPEPSGGLLLLGALAILKLPRRKSI